MADILVSTKVYIGVLTFHVTLSWEMRHVGCKIRFPITHGQLAAAGTTNTRHKTFTTRPESTLGGIRESLSLGMFRRTKFALMKRVFKRGKKILQKKGGLGRFSNFYEVDIKLFSLIMQFQLNSFYKWNKVKTTGSTNSDKSFCTMTQARVLDVLCQIEAKKGNPIGLAYN